MLIGSVFFFAKQQSKTDMKYSQIVSMFRNDEIKEYTLDLSSGSLVYSTFKEPKKEQNYTVPNVSIFLDDVTESVDEYNLKNPDNQIVYDYKAGRSGSILINILPTLISVLLIAGLGYMLYRSMSNAANSDINRSMSFGKIRPKSLISDEKRKTTFGDVAGCEEEKDELEELVDFLKEPE
jgi:cell division protease FtsH